MWTWTQQPLSPAGTPSSSAATPAGLPALIAEDAVFRSPVVHTPQEGRDTVVGYLTAAFTVLGPALTYEREWLGGDSRCCGPYPPWVVSTSAAST